MSKLGTKIAVLVALVAVAVIGRVVPHLANFTPVVAVALVAGVYLGRKWGIATALIAMLISDFFIGFYTWQIMLAVYGSFALVALISVLIKKSKKIETIAATSFLSSTLFFLTTNAAVWQFTTLYTKDFSGLLTSYAMALPFLRNMFLGDLFYTFALFAVAEATIYLYNRSKARQLVAA